jgi:hypothetical protein
MVLFMAIDQKCMKYLEILYIYEIWVFFYMLTITNIVMVQYLYVLSFMFNMVRTFASRKYTQDFVTKLFSYNSASHRM